MRVAEIRKTLKSKSASLNDNSWFLSIGGVTQAARSMQFVYLQLLVFCGTNRPVRTVNNALEDGTAPFDDVYIRIGWQSSVAWRRRAKNYVFT